MDSVKLKSLQTSEDSVTYNAILIHIRNFFCSSHNFCSDQDNIPENSQLE